MKNKWLLYLVLFMLAVNAALITTMLIKNKSIAQEDVGYRHDHKKNHLKKSHEGFENHLAKELGLNETQQDKIRGFSDEFHEKQKYYRNEVFELRKEYFNSLSQANPDTIVLSELASKIGEVEALRIKLEYMHYRNVRSVCNNEQAMKMDSLGRMHMKQRFNRNSEGKCRQMHSEK